MRGRTVEEGHGTEKQRSETADFGDDGGARHEGRIRTAPAALRRADPRGTAHALRLPAGGRRRPAVLGSAAGPFRQPRDRRLAVPTEDHALEYRDFEGVIPPGEYGSGTVIVWDQGTYEPLGHDERGTRVPFAESLERGHATFRLSGEKLRGEFALIRFRTGQEEGGRGQEAWLLIKAKDEQAVRDRPGTPDPYHARSARTGRTLHQVSEAESHRGSVAR